MAELAPAHTLNVAISCPPDKVYEFVRDVHNLPRWAAGLSGEVQVRFADKNHLGVLDHHVTLPSGTEVYVPMRVLACGSGSTVILTLFHTPDMSDARYAEDMRMVQQDLATLKALLE